MNYGAEMQTYATVRALTKLGHDVTIIDLRLSDIANKSIKGQIAKIVQTFSPNNRHFNKFWNTYFPKTKRYQSLDLLRRNPPLADMYLVGSDQTWNPDIMKSLLPASVLDFGDENALRASYASSFGINVWNFSHELTEIVRNGLYKFNNISCRELTGCDILKQVFNRDAINVLDPTLLHSEYREIVGDIKETPTLAFYPLSLEDKELAIYAKQLAEKLHLKVVNVNEYRTLVGCIVWERTLIKDWISNIASAQFVLTRSFHGLAFSIIYKRQFAIVINNNKSSRIKDLLTDLGLQNRLFTDLESCMKSRVWEEKINYNEVEVKLNILRDKSWNYLKSLGNA